MMCLILLRAAEWFGVVCRAGVRIAEIFDELRRDKSGSPPVSQVIDMTCLLPCRSVEARAVISDFVSFFNAVFGTAAIFATEGSLS